MTRRLLAAALTIAVALPAATSPASAQASAWARASVEPTAESLYDQGRTAYRLGKFKEAVEAWEKSYDLSNGNPLLLYNISLAYRGLFGVTNDLKDLRQAEAVMKSFITVAEADPALEGEIADARARREELIAEIQAEEAKRKTTGSDAAEKAFLEAEARRVRDEKRAKKLHLAGAITMGVGGAVFLTGAALGTLFVVRSSEFRDQVTRDRKAVENALPDATMEQRDDCVDDESVASAALDVLNMNAGVEELPAACRPALQELGDLGQTRINGKKANSLAIVGFAVVGGIGLAAIIAGAVVFTQGNRAARDAKAAKVQFSPMIGGRSGTGFMLHGRF